jgi:hypothetical protein
LAAVAGACLVAALGLATDDASANYTAGVQAGTLQLTGDGAGDSLLLAPTPTTLSVVVNGTLAFNLDRSTFTAVHVDVQVAPDVSALITPIVDLGAGQ